MTTDDHRQTGARIHIVISVLVLLTLGVAALLWGPDLVGILKDRERVALLIQQAGPSGPLIVIGLTVAQVLAAPIPGQAVQFAAGVLYGLWWGSLYGWIGTVIGSMLAIGLARVIGRTLLTRFVDERRLAKLDHYAEGRGLIFFLLLFLVPFLPDDMGCFLAGLSSLPLPALFAVVAVGRLPGVVTAVWLGAEAIGAPWQVVALGSVLAALLAFIAWRKGEAIQEKLLRWIGQQ